MALEALLMVVGARQGLMTGLAGRPSETEARVLFMSHMTVAPRSPSTGLPTGKRHHKPVLVRKEFNTSSLGFQQALVTNEVLTEVRLRFFVPSLQGPPKHYFTAQLFDAGVTSQKTFLPQTRTRPRAKPGGPPVVPLQFMWEEVSFTYATIQWTWNDPQMVGRDDWMIAR